MIEKPNVLLIKKLFCNCPVLEDLTIEGNLSRFLSIRMCLQPMLRTYMFNSTSLWLPSLIASTLTLKIIPWEGLCSICGYVRHRAMELVKATFWAAEFLSLSFRIIYGRNSIFTYLLFFIVLYAYCVDSIAFFFLIDEYVIRRIQDI